MEEQKTTLQEPKSNQTELASQEIIVNPPEIKKKKKIIMAGCISALAVILAIVLVVTYINSPIRRFDAALNSDDATTAQSLYATNASNKKFTNKAQAAVEEYIQKSTDAYCNDEIEYKVAKQRISDLSWCPDADEVQKDALETINNVRTSRDKYTKAEWALSKEDYLSALTNFKEVVEDDKKDYASAQQKISETSEAWCQSAINAANTALAENNAVQAYIALNEVNAEYRNDQLREMLTDAKAKAQESVATQLQGKINSGAFKDAYFVVTSIPKELINDRITNLKAEISNGLLGQAKDKANAGDYKAAIALLTDNGNSIDGSFADVVSGYQKKQDEKTLQSLKGYFKVQYDSIDKEYKIVPYNRTIGNKRNLTQDISLRENSVSFYVFFGFKNNNWIFMDKITIDCDGNQFILQVDYSNSSRKVGYGEISEAAGFSDEPLLGALTDYNSMFVDLEPIINAMNDATKVTVRFSGKGHKDVTIPRSQIEELNGFWIAYNILKSNPDLVSVIA